MHLASISFENLGSAAWYLVMVACGAWLAVVPSWALRFIDNGFAKKQRENPAGALKQVNTFRILGLVFALAGVALFAFKLLGVGK